MAERNGGRRLGLLRRVLARAIDAGYCELTIAAGLSLRWLRRVRLRAEPAEGWPKVQDVDSPSLLDVTTNARIPDSKGSSYPPVQKVRVIQNRRPLQLLFLALTDASATRGPCIGDDLLSDTDPGNA